MTTRIIPFFGLALLLTVPAFSHAEDKAAEAADKKESEVKTVEVELKGGLKLNVPESWKQSKPSSRLRLAQFDIPAAKGDEEGGELAIFNFGFGGGAKANIERWIGQFQADDREVRMSSFTYLKANICHYNDDETASCPPSNNEDKKGN